MILQIDLEVFFTLTDIDLLAIGVDEVNQRDKVLDFIQDFTNRKLKRSAPHNSSQRNVTVRK